tara:strand:- start:230 stop:514 length:285 start_codon:yes stop_codon:yes gene_type:complete
MSDVTTFPPALGLQPAKPFKDAKATIIKTYFILGNSNFENNGVSFGRGSKNRNGSLPWNFHFFQTIRQIVSDEISQNDANYDPHQYFHEKYITL